MLPEIGYEGQEKIRKTKVLLIGAGGIGSSAAYYLAVAGIGKIGIADDDIVEVSNLNRQILHNPGRIGLLKVSSAKQTLEELAPSIDVAVYPGRFETSHAVTQIIDGYDIIIDCSDNYPTRFAINDACIQARKPWIYGAVSGFEGQAMSIIPGEGPCYRCLYPSAPTSAMENDLPGVIGVTPGIIGLIQATEAIKYTLGKGSLLIGRLLFIDLLDINLSEFRVQKNANCPACGSVELRKPSNMISEGNDGTKE